MGRVSAIHQQTKVTMEYCIFSLALLMAVVCIVICNKINNLQHQLNKQHSERVNDFNGLVGCLHQLAELIQAVQQSETSHWQVTNTSMACVLGAAQYDLNLFRDAALEDEEYELIPQIDNLINSIHQLIDSYNSWQQRS